MEYRLDSTPDFLRAVGDDARKWAEAFCEHYGKDKIDVDLMTAWFASAIEHSYDIRTRRVRDFLAQIT